MIIAERCGRYGAHRGRIIARIGGDIDATPMVGTTCCVGQDRREISTEGCGYWVRRHTSRFKGAPPPLWWLAVACCIEQDRIPLPVADDVLNKLSPNYRSCRCRGDNAGAVRADLVVLQDHHAQPDMGPRRADAARRARRAGASPQHATRRAGPRRRRGNIGSAPATLRSRCCLRRTRATCAESCADMVNERPGPCGRTLVRLATEALCDASSVGLWTRAGADGAPTGE